MFLTIDKNRVMAEVEQTTSYAGAKTGDYKRVAATSFDCGMLERFWQECRYAVLSALRRVGASDEMIGDTLRIHIEPSPAFDAGQLPSMEAALESYFVSAIVAKWLQLASKAEAADYASHASDVLGDVQRKAVWKRRPER